MFLSLEIKLLTHEIILLYFPVDKGIVTLQLIDVK